MKIGIIGKGNVGSAIGSGLSRAGYEVKHGHRDPKEPVEDAAKWGDVVFLAVPFDNVSDAAAKLASFVDNKVVVDCDECHWRKLQSCCRMLNFGS